MIDRVTQQVSERILAQFQHLTVDLGIATVQLQQNILAAFAGQVTDHARKLAEQGGHRQHPGAANAVLQVVRDQLQVVAILGELRPQGTQLEVQRIKVAFMAGEKVGHDRPFGLTGRPAALLPALITGAHPPPFFLPVPHLLFHGLRLLNHPVGPHSHHQQLAQRVHQPIELGGRYPDSILNPGLAQNRWRFIGLRRSGGLGGYRRDGNERSGGRHFHL